MASGENNWRGRRCGRLLRQHGARLAWPRLVRCAWSAHREIGRLEANATFLAAVPIPPKDVLKLKSLQLMK